MEDHAAAAADSIRLLTPTAEAAWPVLRSLPRSPQHSSTSITLRPFVEPHRITQLIGAAIAMTTSAQMRRRGSVKSDGFLGSGDDRDRALESTHRGFDDRAACE